MAITAKELAKKLNLSAAAVSLALNNRSGVSDETRQMVFEAAKEAGFDFTRLSEKKPDSGTICFQMNTNGLNWCRVFSATFAACVI